jgi:hypothetical protein
MKLANWSTLIKERFPPASYGPLILVFCLANLGADRSFLSVPWTIVAMAIVLAFSFFLRLRLFDEIKDYETDKILNPTRPLARGVLTTDEVKFGIFLLILLEAVIFFLISPRAYPAWLLTLCYSLLMYNEFFLSKWLRPKLTTYAVTHTFVSVLMGLALWNFAMAAAAIHLPWPIFLANWALFNLFEFARKSFAPSEEREGVDSYTKVFGLKGAVRLSFSQYLLFFGIVCYYDYGTSSYGLSIPFLVGGLLLLAFYSFACLRFWRKPQEDRAIFFRNATGLVLLCSYLFLMARTLFGESPS